MRTLIVIPARMASTRLPGKMLLDRTGMPLIQHTYLRAVEAKRADEVVVATDDSQIFEAVQQFGGRVVMTSIDHQSGSERAAEVAAQFPDFPLVCNVQGDEPEIEPRAIDQAIEVMIQGIQEGQDPVMATLATPIQDAADLQDPACVKVVVDQKKRALYFSRSLIPHPREGAAEWLAAESPCFFQHVGLYVYRREFLMGWGKLPFSRLEQMERLEQLRVLDAGFEIMVDVVAGSARGIDTPEDYEAFVSRQIN